MASIDASTATSSSTSARRGGKDALFDADFLKKLEWLSLIARQLVQGRRQALRQSVKKGASIEFKDFREYSPGDDPRSVDWLAYARLGQLYIKLFRQEEELDLWVMLDRSKSMDFGEPNKFNHARRIAAALAYIGMSTMDSSSVLPFDDKLQQGPERMRGKGEVFRLLESLTALKADGKTDLEQSVRMFLSRVRRPSMVVVMSDFYGLQKAKAAIDRLRFLKHQVHIIQLVSPWELDPPLRGELRLVDTETGGHADITISDSMLRRYKESFAAFSAELRAYSMGGSIGYDLAKTDQPFDDFVRGVLQHGRLLA